MAQDLAPITLYNFKSQPDPDCEAALMSASRVRIIWESPAADTTIKEST